MNFLVKPPESLGYGHPAVVLATWFYSGLLRPASGTWGTLAALPFAWVILSVGGAIGGKVVLAIATGLVFYFGVRAADLFEAASPAKDPGSVVVDEVAGMWLTLLFVPNSSLGFLVAFLAFRFFDILKIWPVSYADKQLKGGIGIMADDIFAGLYAGVSAMIILMLIG